MDTAVVAALLVKAEMGQCETPANNGQTISVNSVKAMQSCSALHGSVLTQCCTALHCMEQ